MKRLVMTNLTRTDALSDGEGALVELETSEGPLELRFTYEDAERLITALHTAREKIQVGRTQAAKPPLPQKEKPVTRWETALDPVNQDAVIRAHYPDHTTQETRIPRTEIAALAQFLDQALKRLEPGTDMRQ